MAGNGILNGYGAPVATGTVLDGFGQLLSPGYRRSLLLKVTSPLATPYELPIGSSFISWASKVSGDETSIWSASTNPSRIYVPTGMNRMSVRISLEVAPMNGTPGLGAGLTMTLVRSAASLVDGYPWCTLVLTDAVTNKVHAVSANMPVTEGTYYQVKIDQTSDATEQLYNDDYAHWVQFEWWRE